MNTWLRDSWALMCVVAAFIAGFLFAQPIDGEWRPDWEILSAIGTASAAIVAVAIYNLDRDQKRAEARARALVLAARIYLPLDRYQRKVEEILGWLSHLDPANFHIRGIPERIEELDRLANNKVVADTDMHILIPLAGDLATLIAGAYGNIDIALAALRDFQEKYGIQHSTLIPRRSEVHVLAVFALGDASQQLRIVVRECQEASIALTRTLQPKIIV